MMEYFLRFRVCEGTRGSTQLQTHLESDFLSLVAVYILVTVHGCELS